MDNNDKERRRPMDGPSELGAVVVTVFFGCAAFLLILHACSPKGEW